VLIEKLRKHSVTERRHIHSRCPPRLNNSTTTAPATTGSGTNAIRLHAHDNRPPIPREVLESGNLRSLQFEQKQARERLDRIIREELVHEFPF
jgi:hypothetical protein